VPVVAAMDDSVMPIIPDVPDRMTTTFLVGIADPLLLYATRLPR
jgi:hypothetical protein